MTRARVTRAEIETARRTLRTLRAAFTPRPDSRIVVRPCGRCRYPWSLVGDDPKHESLRRFRCLHCGVVGYEDDARGTPDYQWWATGVAIVGMVLAGGPLFGWVLVNPLSPDPILAVVAALGGLTAGAYRGIMRWGRRSVLRRAFAAWDGEYVKASNAARQETWDRTFERTGGTEFDLNGKKMVTPTVEPGGFLRPETAALREEWDGLQRWRVLAEQGLTTAEAAARIAAVGQAGHGDHPLTKYEDANGRAFFTVAGQPPIPPVAAWPQPITDPYDWAERQKVAVPDKRELRYRIRAARLSQTRAQVDQKVNTIVAWMEAERPSRARYEERMRAIEAALRNEAACFVGMDG